MGVGGIVETGLYSYRLMLKYKRLSKYLQQIVETGRQVKSVVYSKDFPLNIPMSLSLLSTCVNNISQLDMWRKRVEYSQKIEIADRFLFYIMVGEYINTGKIVGGGKLKRVIVTNSGTLDIPIKAKITKSNVQIRVRNGLIIGQLDEYPKDIHVPGLHDLPYQDYSELSRNNQELFQSDKVVIQSKSSCLPAWLIFQDLTISGRCDVIDCCAAPGNKTIQLCEYINTKGKVIAFQKSEERYNLLNRRVLKYRITNIKTHNEDFLKTDPANKKYRHCRMILADPSCSGSGMLVNFPQVDAPDCLNFEEFCKQRYDNLSSQEKERVCSLQRFQLSILNHCAKFRPLRISYSTCSIYQKQNEEVVRLFLQSNPSYRIKRRPRALTELPTGFGQVGHQCVRVNPMKRQTDGFFVCVFKERSRENGPQK